jgi:hypothetical protein
MLPTRAARPNIANANEPEAIRNLKKKALYKLLNDRFLLPEENSKGVNRQYLVGVYTGALYRIDLMEYKRFEIELTPAQLKKTPFLNTADAYVKLSRLLEELGLSPLGFDIGAFPEDTWLYKVIRFVDRNNATGVYLERVNAPLPQNIANSPSSVMMRAKRNAEHFLINGIMQVKSVYPALKTLWDCHKKEISRRREVEQLTRELDGSRQRLEADRAALNAALSRASMVVFSAGTGQQIDELLDDDNANAEHHRLQLMDITSM